MSVLGLLGNIADAGVILDHSIKINTSLSADLSHLLVRGPNPLGALPGGDTHEVHGVNLLDGAALALDDEEVDDEASEEVAGGKDVTVAEVDGLGDEGGEEADAEVPGPVAGGGKTHGLGTVARGEDLGEDGPDDGAPGGSEAQDEDGREDDQGNASLGGVLGVLLVEREVADRGVDHEADKHQTGTSDEALATAIVLNNVEAEESGQEVDGVDDDLGDERVDLDGAEDDGAVVEEVVGTSQDLEHLQRAAEQEARQHAGSREHAGKLGDGAQLDVVLGAQLGLDVLDLGVDGIVVLTGTMDVAERLDSALPLAARKVVARRLREELDADTQADGPQESDAEDDAPGGRAVHLVLVGAVVEAGSQEDTHGDEQLVAADQGTADPRRSSLSLVHGDKEGEGTNAQTSDQTADGDLVPGHFRGDLDDEADDSNKGSDGDGGLAADLVSDGSGDQGTHESTDGQNGHNEAGADVAEVVLGHAGGGIDDGLASRVELGLAEAAQVVGHGQETRDGTGIVTEAVRRLFFS